MHLVSYLMAMVMPMCQQTGRVAHEKGSRLERNTCLKEEQMRYLGGLVVDRAWYCVGGIE